MAKTGDHVVSAICNMMSSATEASQHTEKNPSEFAGSIGVMILFSSGRSPNINR